MVYKLAFALGTLSFVAGIAGGTAYIVRVLGAPPPIVLDPLVVARDSYDAGDFERAVAEYHAALRVNPVSAIAHGGLGAALANRGEYDLAIEQLTD